MRFHITGQRLHDKGRQVFVYDNETNTLSDASGQVFSSGGCEAHAGKHTPVVPFSPEEPLRKSKRIRTLKIQLGLSCNYACDYCSQRFVEHAPETSRKDIEAFIDRLGNLEFNEARGLKIEFWGGEPLVYWKTLVPLKEALDLYFAGWEKKPVYSMITNGSLLNREIVQWLVENEFIVAMSHDGPGQAVRGPDPLDDDITRSAVRSLYRQLRPRGRFSFNAMLNQSNYGRREIYEWFVAFTGDPSVPLGEGSVIDAYDEGGTGNSLATKADHFAFRRRAFNDVFANDGQIGFGGILGKVDGFTTGVLTHRPASSLGQKCGMDKPGNIAIDLRGNVITCQNVSASEVAKNGAPHLGGNIEKIEEVELKSATHWRNRANCAACPVLHLCKGSCMYLQGEYWDVSCANSYSDNIALFALSFEKMTGYIPVLIDAPGLPDDRRDIFGTEMEHIERPRRKMIPIVAV
ncbi:radical SAM/SPASM domain-containing protein [Paraburkholderia sp. BCC1886]|uniref:radical SAM/SPASM domain-containing protein n=1 Tax=Paraburkholderia sp. BCC1886 TaxID=2562670 RepID=UPI0011845C6B|nr:radical SAM protein [Paraburkholderia sp. BCC1886]